MKYILLGRCSLLQCVHSACCGVMHVRNIYVGVMCPVFSSAHARVNACASALVYTPEYKYNFSCTSLQRLSGLDTYVLVCGRTRRLSLSRSLSRALALSYTRAHAHTQAARTSTPTPAHTHPPTHTHTQTCTRAHRCICVCMVYRQQSTYSHTHAHAGTHMFGCGCAPAGVCAARACADDIQLMISTPI